MGANAKTSGKWASKETWKVVLIHNTEGTRIPFYSHTGWAAQREARQHMKANRLQVQDYTMTEPVEVFKRGINWDTAVEPRY